MGAGVLHKTPDPEDGRRRLYAPTPKGVALAPILLELAIWGAEPDQIDSC